MSIQWAAGLFDGEGSFSIHTDVRRINTTFSVKAQLEMTHELTVRTFYSIVDIGSVRIERTGHLIHKDTYRFLASGLKASIVAEKLKPYLITKKQQAELIIEFNTVWARRINGESEPLSEDIYAQLRVIASELKDLNKKGK